MAGSKKQKLHKKGEPQKQKKQRIDAPKKSIREPAELPATVKSEQTSQQPSSKSITNNKPVKPNDLPQVFQQNGNVVSVAYIDETQVDAYPELDENEDLLGSFLHPLTPEQFHKYFWKKRAYATIVKENVANIPRIQNIIENHLFGLDLASMLKHTASESIFVWMRPLESASSSSTTTSDKKQQPVESFELDGDNRVNSAMICHGAGASLYFRSPSEMAEMFITRMTQQLGIGFGGMYSDGTVKGEIEVFASRKGHVTDWHFDFMENFTVQLAGKKTWKLMKSNVNHPLRGCTPHYKGVDTAEQQLKVHHMKDPNFTLYPQSFDEVEEVTLTAGSVFYFPAGTLHRVECEEDSISINISLISSSWADVVSDAIRQLLWSKDEWREGVCYQNPRDARQKMTTLLGRLKDDISSLEVESVLPNGLFLPHGLIYDLSTMEDVELENDPKMRTIKDETAFRFNPVAVLIPLKEVPEEAYLEEAEVEGEESDEDDHDHDHDSDSGSNKHSHSKKHSKEEEQNDGDDDEEERIYYALHISFGNEEMSSAVRVKIAVPKALQACVDDLRVASRQPSASVVLNEWQSKYSNDDPAIESLIVRLFKLLNYHGYLHQIKQDNKKMKGKQ